MISILLDLLGCKADRIDLILESIRFFPKRSNLKFVFVSDIEPTDEFLHIKNCQFCGYDLNLEWFVETENMLINLFYLKDKFQVDSIISFRYSQDLTELPGYYEIVTPFLNLYSLSDNIDHLYEIPDENILAMSLNKLCLDLTNKNVKNIQFIRSQINYYTELENYVLDQLKILFNVKVINYFDFMHQTQFENENYICFFPNNIINYFTLSIPSSYTVISHKFNFPVYYSDSRLNVQTGYKQHLRFTIQSILDSNNENLSHITSYRSFARLYDQYMNHVAYSNWVDFLLQQYRMIKKEPPKAVLEIACGTGSIAHLFSDLVPNVYATDQSPEMMDICLEKGKSIHSFQSDMTDFNLRIKTDFIVCLFDSVNYLTDKNAVLNLFKMVTLHLVKDGLFIFDISTLLNSEEHFDGFINLEDYENAYVLHQADYFKKKMTQETNLNIFTRTFLNYRREDEIHQQKVWKVKELIEFINLSELTLTGIYDINNLNNLINSTTEKLDSKYYRLFFVLSKNDD